MSSTITQALLGRYSEYHATEKEAKLRREALRAEILALAEAGAPVERGALTLTITSCRTLRTSWSKLEEILDSPMIAYLRNEISPTITTQVSVRLRED